MIPYFSVSVEINPADDDGHEYRDQNSLRVSIAREFEASEDTDEAITDTRTSNEIAVVDKLMEAIVWLAANSPAKDPSGFLSFLMQRIAGHSQEALAEFLDAETESGDADWGDAIRQTAKKCEESGI